MSYQNKKTLRDLHLTERFLFAEAMEDPVISKNMLEIIMDKEIHLLSSIETEKELRSSEFLRSVRLDMFALDDEDNLYNTEMQREKEGDLIRRSRFYQAMIDHSLLVPGENEFSDLKDSYMISIMPFDLFGLQKYLYAFQMKCINAADLELRDGATRIFINTHGKNEADMKIEFIELMRYINKTREEVANECQSPKVREIHRRLERIRSDEEVGVRWMQEWEEKLKIKKEAEKKGLEKGLEEGIIMSLDFGVSYDVVCSKLMELFHISEDEARERISRYQKSV